MAKCKLYTEASCQLRQISIIFTALGQEVKTEYAARGNMSERESFLPTKDSYLKLERCVTGMS